MRISIAVASLLVLAGCASTPEPPHTSSVGSTGQPESTAEIYARLGAGYIRNGSYALALSRLQKALDIDPDLPEANHYMGELYARLDEWDTAERYFQKALRSAPDDSALNNNYGVFLCRRGEYDKAKEHLFEVLKDPFYQQKDEVYSNLAQCALKAGDEGKARNYFGMALDLNPLALEPLLNMANLSLESHDYAGALEYVERFRGAAGGYNPDLLVIAIKAARGIGDSDRAASYALLLQGRFPDSAQAKQLGAAIEDRQ